MSTVPDGDVVMSGDGHVFMSYADFGKRFFETAVTRERIEKATAGLTGRDIEFGPKGVGPLGLVKVSAQGAVGIPVVERAVGESVAYDLLVPVELHMVIEIGIDKNRFNADVRVRLALTARAAEPLRIVIDIEPPTAGNVEVDLKADGLRASVLQLVGGIDGELRRTVAKVVKRELERPELLAARVIDVGKALDAMSVPKT